MRHGSIEPGELAAIRADADLGCVFPATSDWAPDWSPGGAQIVFARGSQLWTMRPDGSRVRQLTRRPGPPGQPIGDKTGRLTTPTAEVTQ